MAKFEAAFDSTKIKNLYTMNYNAIFMFRRLIFVVLCVYFDGENNYILQLVISYLVQLCYLMYLFKHKPHAEYGEFKLEVYTESSLLLFLYVMLTFTEFVPDPLHRHEMGLVAGAIFFLNIFVG